MNQGRGTASSAEAAATRAWAPSGGSWEAARRQVRRLPLVGMVQVVVGIIVSMKALSSPDGGVDIGLVDLDQGAGSTPSYPIDSWAPGVSEAAAYITSAQYTIEDVTP